MSVLAPTQALAPGADLWVVSTPEESRWALKIDWELNFQMLRASRHEKKQLSDEVQGLLRKTGLNFESASFNEAPLLVAADMNLPCRWVLSLKDWKTEGVAKVWKQLGEPSVRIFLPKNQSADRFAREWAHAAGESSPQFVVE